MNKQMSLDLFREALIKAEEQLEAEMAERATRITVTQEQHEQGVARIMEAFRRHRAIKVKRRILISILAAVLAILTSCTIYVHREKIAAFVEEFYHNYIDVSYGEIDDGAPKEIQTVYQPSYIPEGYELAESHSNSARVRMKWVNQDGEKIVFVQALLTGDLLSWDSEKGAPQELILNEKTVYYSKYENKDIYIWNDGRYTYKLTLTEDFPSEEIENIMTLVTTNSE